VNIAAASRIGWTARHLAAELNRMSIDPGDSSAAALPTKTLSTDDVPLERRLAYWVDAVCSLYCDLECEPPPGGNISGSVEFRGIGDLTFTWVRSNGLAIRRTAERIRAGREDTHLMVLLPRKGSFVLHQGGRETSVQRGDFVFHDCARPYELRFGAPDHALYALRMPRNLLARHVRNLDDLTAITVARQAGAGALLLAMVETLHRDLATLHPSSAVGVCEGITSIVAAGLRSLPSANLQAPTNLAAYHLARIKAYVHEHLGDPHLSAASIAAAIGLSADHVSRLFRAEPVSLSRFVWQQRLEACRRDLADVRLARRNISEIAFSWGFSDAAHFSRTFMRQNALSPSAWRRRVFGELQQPVPPLAKGDRDGVD